MTFRTKNTTYTLTDAGDGAFLISGSTRYCPTPTLVTLPFGPPVKGQCVTFKYVTPPPNTKPYVITTRVQRISQ